MGMGGKPANSGQSSLTVLCANARSGWGHRIGNLSSSCIKLVDGKVDSEKKVGYN